MAKASPDTQQRRRDRKGIGGQPSEITTVLGQREDGTDITVADQIVTALNTGAYFEHACAAGGVGKNTGNEWLRVAGKARIRARGVGLDNIELTDHERACLEFSTAVERAESQWLVGSLGSLERLARGGIPQVTTTVKTERREDSDGNVSFVEVERTIVTKTTLPSAQVLEWRLARRFPEFFGDRVEIIDKRGALTTDERAAALLEALDMIDDINEPSDKTVEP